MKVSKRGLKNKLERKLKMLTKEECKQALEHIKTLRGSNYGWYYSGFNNSALPFDEDINVVQELMHEHFDNPPLKFEELIKHKVIWDNELKEYAFVLEQYKPTILNVTAPSDLQAISLEYRGGEIECLLSEKVEEVINDYYEPNRFYRKEVQE